MDAAPAITSAGALLASTPLLAAAQLWSWHPLWAAGIWTVYGIGALAPQGEAWLHPLFESPCYNGYDMSLPVYDTPEPDVVIIETTPHNATTSMSTSTLSAAFNSALTPFSIGISDHALAIASNFTETSMSPPVAMTAHTSTSSSVPSPKPTSPSSNSGIVEHVKPSVLEEDGSITRVHGHKNLDHGNVRITASTKAYNFSWDTWARLALSWMILAGLAGLMAWRLWVEILRPIWMYANACGVVEAVRPWYNAGVQQLSDIEFVSPVLLPPRKYVFRLWKWVKLAPRLARHLLFETQVGAEGAGHDVLAIRQQLAHLIWGGATPRSRAARALTIYWLSLCLISCICWPLSTHLASFVSVAWIKKSAEHPAHAFIKVQSHNSAINAPAIGNTTNMFFACLSQLKSCALTAYTNHLHSDGTYDLIILMPSRTATICIWIESFVMYMRFMTMLIRTSSAAAHKQVTTLKQCFAESWENYLSPDGVYHQAPYTVPTAAWCRNIETSVMKYRITTQAFHPLIARLKAISSSVCGFLGCLPFISMFSGSVCLESVHLINRSLGVALFSIVGVLNSTIIMRWPVPKQRSAAEVKMFAMVILCLGVVPILASWWFLWFSQTSIELEWLTAVVAVGVFELWRNALAVRWTASLRTLL